MAFLWSGCLFAGAGGEGIVQNLGKGWFFKSWKAICWHIELSLVYSYFPEQLAMQSPKLNYLLWGGRSMTPPSRIDQCRLGGTWEIWDAKRQFLGFSFLRRPPVSVFVETLAQIKRKCVCDPNGLSRQEVSLGILLRSRLMTSGHNGPELGLLEWPVSEWFSKCSSLHTLGFASNCMIGTLNAIAARKSLEGDTPNCEQTEEWDLRGWGVG